MRKLFVAGIALIMLGSFSLIKADSYAVILTSYTIGSNTTTFAATYPQIRGGVKIDKLIFVTTNTITTPLIIGVYDTATSTTAASAVKQYYIVSSSATNTMGGNGTMIDYPAHNPLALTNPAFFKADGDTTHQVFMSIIYR